MTKKEKKLLTSALVGKVKWDDIKEHFIIKTKKTPVKLKDIITKEDEVTSKREEEVIEEIVDKQQTTSQIKYSNILNHAHHVAKTLYDQEPSPTVGQILYNIEQIKEIHSSNSISFMTAMDDLQSKLNEVANDYDDVSAYYVSKIIGLLKHGYTTTIKHKEKK